MSSDFLLTSIIVILLPGPGVLYTLAFGLESGWRASVLAAFGCTLGIIPHIVGSIVGLAALLHTSALAFQLLKYLGVIYLLYMALSIIREQRALQITPSPALLSAPRIIRNGFLLGILNPKLSLFFLAFLPQFVPTTANSATAHMTWLAIVFMLLTFIVFVGYGAFASAARNHVVTKPHVMIWLQRGFAGAFVALGLRLALFEH